jgi:hypothetical protein
MNSRQLEKYRAALEELLREAQPPTPHGRQGDRYCASLQLGQGRLQTPRVLVF